MTLPSPKGRQSDVVYLPASGHQVVLGTAGTGKTVMAMLRSLHLSKEATKNSGKTLLVTHNNALVTYLHHLQPTGSDAITVETYGRFARGYLNSQGRMAYNAIADPNKRQVLVTRAIASVRGAHKKSKFLKRDTGFFLDELEWISGMGLSSAQDYGGADRYGREEGLNPRQRTLVWEVRREYQELLAAAKRPYDWPGIPSAVRAAVADDGSPSVYRHVVIDEGQDLSPEAIRSLVEVVDPDGSVTFFGDYAQQIYGQDLSWRKCGLKISKVERFRNNYRNTAEIARLAIALSEMDHFGGDPEDLVEPQEPKAAGPLPGLVRCDSESSECELIRDLAPAEAKAGTVAILARTWAQARQACRGLPARDLRPDLEFWDASPGIYCGAYHSAKGLEFDAVFLPFCGSSRLPHPPIVSAFGREEAAGREAKLLYVAVTRARTNLVVSHSGELTPLLPDDDALWQRSSR